MDAAPLLAGLALLAVTLLGVAALLYLAIRRSQAPVDDGYAEPLPEPQAPVRTAEVVAAPVLSEVRRNRLVKALVEERTVRNGLVREALVRGESALVAQWALCVGEFLLEDLRGDRTLSVPIRAVALALRDVRAATPEQVAQAMEELESRLFVAQLSHAQGSVDEAFAFLSNVTPEHFVAAAADLNPQALEVCLRFAPPHLRSAALKSLVTEQKERLALAWARPQPTSTDYALAVAAELRERVANSDGRGTDGYLEELFDQLPREEQDALLAKLAAETVTGLPKGLRVESDILTASRSALACAVLAVDPSKVVTYLRGSDAPLRERLLAAAPTRIRSELEEELQLQAGTPNPVDFLEARKLLLAQLPPPSATERPERPRLVSNTK